MSLFSSVGHFLGDIFGGDDPKKKKQQQQQSQPQPTIIRPTNTQQSQSNNSIVQPAQQSQQPQNMPDNGVNLFQGGLPQKANKTAKAPQAGSFDPNAPLNKAQPKPQPESLPTRIINSGKNVASAGAGTALAATRIGEGVVHDAIGIPSAIGHLGKWMGDTYTGEKTDAPWLNKIDSLTKAAQKPVDVVAQKTDQAAQAYGKPADKVYKPAQVVGNVAAIVPGLAEAGAKVATMTGKAEGLVPTLEKIGAQGKSKVVTAAKDAATNTVKNLFKHDAPAVEQPGPAVIAPEPTQTAPASTEVSPGVHSVNPNREADAAEQVAQEAPAPAPRPGEIIEPTPAPAPQPGDIIQPNPAEVTPPAAEPIAPTDVPAPSADRSLLEKIVDLLHARQGEQAAGTAPRTLPEVLHPGDVVRPGDQMPTEPGVPVPRAGEVVQPTPQQPAPVAPALHPEVPQMPEPGPHAATAPVSPQPTPVEAPALAGDIAPTPGPGAVATEPIPQGAPAPTTDVPEMPAGQGIPRQAPNAPNIRQAAEKELGDVSKKLEGEQSMHDIVNNEELDTAAQNFTATLSDQELLDRYTTGAKFNNVSDIAQGKAAMDRLGKMATSENPEVAAAATQAIDNILEASEKGISAGGRVLNYAQTFFDSLPRPAKVAYLIRNMDKLRAEKGMSLIKDDVALKAQINSTIDRYLAQGEDIKQTVAEIDGTLQKYEEAAREGKATAQQIKDAQKLNAEKANLELNLQKSQGDLARFYDGQIPNQSTINQRVGDTGRAMMLGSITGRANDVVSTGINTAHALAQMTGESLLGKVANTARKVVGKAPGKYIDTMPSPAAFGRGMKTGLKKSVGEFKGNTYAGDVQKALKSKTPGEKTQLMRMGGNGLLAKTKRFIRAGAELATNGSEGIKQVQLERLAAQEGKQLGLKGDNLKLYTQSRASRPTAAMEANANHLHEEVNNLNDNWVTNLIEGTAGQTAKIPYVGESIKNLAVPFTRWLGGNIYNAATDKNVVANAVKIVAGLAKGDGQMVAKNLSGLAVNSGVTFGVGYSLANSGHLTTTNPEGYDDEGLYITAGGRNIPINVLGFAAPSIILGWATHSVMQQTHEDGTKLTEAIIKAASDAATASFISYGGDTVIGDSSPVKQALTLSNMKNSTVSKGDVLATAAGTAVGQFIPAVTGDINSVLNNGLKVAGKTIVPDKLNPTHEKADTKVTKVNPKTGNDIKDYPKSAVNTVLNKIPVASQKLPRKAGVAAADLFDRVAHSDRDTAASIEEKKTAKEEADTAKYDTKNDIPNFADKKTGFDDAVEARIERQEYGKATEALKQKLESDKKDTNIPASDIKKQEQKITQMEYADEKHLSYDDMNLYNKTSLSEWRNLGDPESDTYDPQAYQRLFDIDKGLAEKGVAGGFHIKGAGADLSDKNKYSAKTSTAKEKAAAADKAAKKAASDALHKVTSNTLGSTPDMGTIDFGKLTPKKITDTTAQIPKIQKIKSSDLVKKRKISVEKA